MTKFVLQLLAMMFMLCDHMCATIMSQHIWLHWIGRLAFPIFAFMLVEGYVHTSSFKKYVKRMFCFALLAEIPLNLCSAGDFFYPFHQNVMWTFLISLFCMRTLDKIFGLKGKEGTTTQNNVIGAIGKVMMAVAMVGIFYWLSFLTFVDYYGYGLLMVLVFYFSRKFANWYTKVTAKAFPKVMKMAFEAIAMYYINVEMISGEIRYLTLFGDQIAVTIQGLAVLALPLIWLYHGQQGYHSKGWQYFCYAFYPVHMLILGLMWMYL